MCHLRQNFVGTASVTKIRQHVRQHTRLRCSRCFHTEGRGKAADVRSYRRAGTRCEAESTTDIQHSMGSLRINKALSMGIPKLVICLDRSIGALSICSKLTPKHTKSSNLVLDYLPRWQRVRLVSKMQTASDCYRTSNHRATPQRKLDSTRSQVSVAVYSSRPAKYGS